MSEERTDTYSFEFVAERLSEAGMTLLALPRSGYSTAMRCFWPEILGAVADERRVSPPPAKRITRMDEALGWITLIPEADIKLRKLVGARALTSPRSEKPIFSWHDLGRQMGCTHKTAKTWWIRGIELIVQRLNQPGLCQTPALQGTRHAAAGALRHARDTLTKSVHALDFA